MWGHVTALCELLERALVEELVLLRRVLRLRELLVLLCRLFFLLSFLLRLLPELLKVERLGGLLAHLAFSLLVAGSVHRLLARSELSLLVRVTPKLGAERAERLRGIAQNCAESRPIG